MKLRASARVVARTPLAPVATFPKRAWRAIRHSTEVASQAFSWLFRSREHTNYTYELTPVNLEHLGWFVTTISGADIGTVRGYFAELAGSDFKDRVRRAATRSHRRYMWDADVRLGSRLGWYALVRCTKPTHIVEAGIDKGLGTAVLAEALRRNAEEGNPGRVTAVDINPDAGDLIAGTDWAGVVDLVRDDSVSALRGMDGPVDLFIHDSVYTDEHEQAEIDALLPLLSERGMVMNARATTTRVLPRVAQAQGWNFLAFYEEPADHWFPGDAVGIAWKQVS